MGVRFDEPLWLVLLALIAPVAWVSLRWLQSMSRLRAWTVFVARALLLAALAGVLAGASAARTSDSVAVIALVDVSESARRFGRAAIAEDGDAAVREWLSRAASEVDPDDLFGVVAFDRSPLAVAAPRRGGWDVADLPLDVSTGEGTDIGAAIEFARAMVPAGARARFVLIGDGVETSGDAARAASAAGTPIDVLPLTYDVQREVVVEFVDAPPTLPSEGAATVRVGVRASAATEGRLLLRRESGQDSEWIDLNGDGEGVARAVTLEPGLNVELAQVRLGPELIHRFEAFFEPDEAEADTIATNNRGSALTVTPGRGAVLLIDGVSDAAPDGAGRVLARTLRAGGVEVSVVPPEAAPGDLLSLQAYDLVILENVAAEELPRSVHGLLADYVRELGGGLVMVGGPDSFGAGGWNGTDLEPVLPVELDLPEQLIIPSAAIVMVMDSSGSMARRVLGGSRTQQEIANEAAAMAVTTLDQSDLVGVLGFSNDWYTVVELGENADPERTAARIRGIAPGGGTNLYPAMQEAGRLLRGVEAEVKHVIVLSDGQSMGSPSSGQQIASGMRDDGISVTTIAVGDDADVSTLESVAARGGGQFYRVVDPNVLPRVFLREIRVVRRPLVRETPFEPVVTASGSSLTAALPGAPPPLGGLVLTQRREDAETVDAMLAPGGEPVLSHWNIGLGQAAAFTSDAHRWASAWLGWPGYAALWRQVARTIARPATGGASELVTELDGDRLRIRLDASDREGEPLDLLTVTGFVYTPGGERVPVRLEQTGPGVYEGSIEARESGSYVAALTPARGERALAPVVGGASRATGEELRRLRSNVALLRTLAEETGGRLLDWERPNEAGLFRSEGVEPVVATSPIWRLLLLWALGIFLADVATRRIAWDRYLDRELASALREESSRALRQRSQAAAATLRSLRGASGSRTRPAERSEPPTAAGMTPEQIRARRERLIRQASAASQRGSAPAQAEAPAAEQASSRSDLLAAKRRVRERYGNDDEGEAS